MSGIVMVLFWKEKSRENVKTMRGSNMTRNTIWKGNYMRLAVVVLVVAVMLIISLGCGEETYTQTIRIFVEPVSVGGLHAKIEYYRDAKLVNSINFIDGNGDGIIDGKSGPTEGGNWPKGWQWFDDLHRDVIVGHSTITITGEKVKFQDGTTYEFLTGEYECERA